MKIAILGAGDYGTAIGGILAEKGYDIDYYDSKVEKERLSDVLDKAKLIVLVAPSKVVPHILPYLPKKTPLLVATKGILDARTFEKFEDVMVVSGPGFAKDIKAHKETHLTMTDARVKELIGADYLTFDETHDVQGVLMCGALKNVYAIMAGLLNLEAGTPEWEQYITEVAGEMRALLSANGAEAATVEKSCGIGDLRLTCNFPSRNYEYGQMLRRDPEAIPTKTVEGVAALRRIRRGEIVIPETALIMRKLINLSAKWRQDGAK